MVETRVSKICIALPTGGQGFPASLGLDFFFLNEWVLSY
jgi:hypothetical protein